MTTPADLVSHYSTKAFQTRMAALTSIGAALGADVVWDDSKIQSGVLGVALLVIVGSLGELNRRYTHSYLCACVAAARSSDQQQQWRDFKIMNERPYSSKSSQEAPTPTPDDLEARTVRGILSRFLLSWGTYLPGLVAGLYLVWTHIVRELALHQPRVWTICAELGVSHILATCLVIWWWSQAATLRNPERILPDIKSKKNVEGGTG